MVLLRAIVNIPCAAMPKGQQTNQAPVSRKRYELSYGIKPDTIDVEVQIR